MTRKTKISDPPEDIGRIVSIVRLLPPDAILKDHWELYFEKIRNDPGNLYSFLREQYEIEDEDAEYYLLSKADEFGDDDDDDSDEFLTDKKRSRAYKREKEWVDYTYQRQALKDCLEDLPSAFLAYIGSLEPTLEQLHESLSSDLSPRVRASFDQFVLMLRDNFMEKMIISELRKSVWRFNEAREYHTRLYSLVNYLESHKADKYGNPYHSGKSKLFAIEDCSIIDGKLVFLSDKFTQAFNGVEIDRLKICENCKKVFWVKRIDMKGCTTPCAKVLRTRKWREKTTEEQRLKYKINRIKRGKGREKED
jgi:hypothetical protein